MQRTLIKVTGLLIGLVVLAGACATDAGALITENTATQEDCQQPEVLRTSATNMVVWHNHMTAISTLIESGASHSELVTENSRARSVYPITTRADITDDDFGNWVAYLEALVGAEKNLSNITGLTAYEIQNNGWEGPVIDLIEGPDSVESITEAHNGFLRSLDEIEKAAHRAFARGFASELCNEISPPHSQT